MLKTTFTKQNLHKQKYDTSYNTSENFERIYPFASIT